MAIEHLYLNDKQTQAMVATLTSHQMVPIVIVNVCPNVPMVHGSKVCTTPILHPGGCILVSPWADPTYRWLGASLLWGLVVARGYPEICKGGTVVELSWTPQGSVFVAASLCGSASCRETCTPSIVTDQRLFIGF